MGRGIGTFDWPRAEDYWFRHFTGSVAKVDKPAINVHMYDENVSNAN